LFKTKGRSGKSANSRKNAAAEQDLTARQEALRKLETDLAKREVELIERELKCYALQQEVDRLRPLSGLYRVVKAMATDRKLERLLESITRETQSMLKCDRCSVFVLEPAEGEIWMQVQQGLEEHHTAHMSIKNNRIVALTASSGQVINIPDAYA